VFTLNDSSDNGGSRSLRRQLKVPKSHLAALAVESGGIVVDARRLIATTAVSAETSARPTTGFIRTTAASAGPADQHRAKLAATTATHWLAAAARPAACQVCDCLPNADGAGYLSCHQCIQPEIDIVSTNWERYN